MGELVCMHLCQLRRQHLLLLAALIAALNYYPKFEPNLLVMMVVFDHLEQVNNIAAF